MNTLKQIIYTDKFLKKRKIAKYSKVLTQLWEKKAENIIALDISKFYSYADFVIICTGTSTKHTQSIADAIHNKAKEMKRVAIIEGYNEGSWILIDLGEVIIHIFTEEKRGLYNIEGLWFDAPLFIIQESQDISDV